MITLRNGGACRELPVAPSSDQTTTRRLMINMPTTASSLHLVF